MQLAYSPQASLDLHQICFYLEVNAGPHTRTRFLDAFEETCTLLRRFPDLGRKLDPQRVHTSGPFELRHIVMNGFSAYLLVYTVMPETILLSRVLHGARHPQGRGVQPS